MEGFPSYEIIREWLDEIEDEVPEAFYKELSGGVLLLPEEMKHRESDDSRPLYILGQYKRNIMGRTIVIYYGSFKKLYSHRKEQAVKKQLKDTLFHEFTHHLESLAGERGLEKKDVEKMKRYKERRYNVKGVEQSE